MCRRYCRSVLTWKTYNRRCSVSSSSRRRESPRMRLTPLEFSLSGRPSAVWCVPLSLREPSRDTSPCTSRSERATHVYIMLFRHVVRWFNTLCTHGGIHFHVTFLCCTLIRVIEKFPDTEMAKYAAFCQTSLKRTKQRFVCIFPY